MYTLNDTALESNKYMKINFAGDALSSDAGLLLVKEFACKLGFVKILKTRFKTVAYREFMYQVGSWDYPRRVVCKVEKRTGQLIHMFTFIVTNMDFSPEELIRFYCKRGVMENFIKESKNGFDFASVSSSSRLVNANRVQAHGLAYNIFNWFKRLALSAKMRKEQRNHPFENAENSCKSGTFSKIYDI